MAILYKVGPHDTIIEGDSLTEQEHIPSCDINKMIRSAYRGQQIRGGSSQQYGYDDTTMDGLQFRIEKQRIEEELTAIAATEELDEASQSIIPKSIQEKFNLKFKKPAKQTAKNDDSTTKNADPKAAQSPNPDPTPVQKELTPTR